MIPKEELQRSRFLAIVIFSLFGILFLSRVAASMQHPSSQLNVNKEIESHLAHTENQNRVEFLYLLIYSE